MAKRTSPAVPRGAPIEVLHAVETLRHDEATWLARIMDACREPLAAPEAYMAAILEYDERSRSYFYSSGRMEGCKPLDEGAALLNGHLDSSLHEQLQHLDGPRSFRSTVRDNPVVVDAARQMGITEVFSLVGRASPTVMAIVASHQDEVWSPSRALSAYWAPVCRSLGRVLRLRRALLAAAGEPDAAFTPDGACAHAGEVVRDDPIALARLRAAVRQRERGRGGSAVAGPAQRAAEGGAAESWDALLDRRWTLLDEFDGDGRRWVLAWDNPRAGGDPRALDARERTVLSRVLAGVPTAETADELGVAKSTVSRLLADSLRKLGSDDLASLARWQHHAQSGRLVELPLGPGGLRAVGIPHGVAEAVAPLSTAERAVLAALLDGRSNREIGAARGTSERTVANQVRAIFDKVGVGSRRELIAWYSAR
jgi:DNA-binding CsgD family transcriptional regulator